MMRRLSGPDYGHHREHLPVPTPDKEQIRASSTVAGFQRRRLPPICAERLSLLLSALLWILLRKLSETSPWLYMDADFEDQRICPQRYWLFAHRGRVTAAHHQRHGNTLTPDGRIHRRPLCGPHQYIHRCPVHSRLHGILMDWRQNKAWHVCL